MTYRHAIQGQLTVDFKLVGRGHSSTGVHQGIAELERTKTRGEEVEIDFFFFCYRCMLDYI